MKQRVFTEDRKALLWELLSGFDSVSNTPDNLKGMLYWETEDIKNQQKEFE